MKIAYVVHRDAYLPDGVARKVNEQVRLWREAENEVRVFTLSDRPADVRAVFGGPVYALPQINGLASRALRLPRQAPVVSRLLRDLDRFAPDVVYLRYLKYLAPIHRLREVSGGYAVELQSFQEEARSYGRLRSYYDVLTRGLVLGNAAAFVCVSHEIAMAKQFAKYGKPSAVIANGVDVDRHEPLAPPANRAPNLVLLGASWSPWQGLDKALSLARAAPKLALHVVGGTPGSTDLGDIPQNVTMHGYLRQSEYRSVLAGADIALGTLALHRKGMSEASPLKVREYLAHGIPTVIAYRDTDLGDADYPFMLKIPNTETNVADHTERIVQFAHAMVGNRADREIIRQLVDSRHKERKRLEFLKATMLVGGP